MRTLKSLVLCAAILVCAPATARAQDHMPVHFNFGGGPTFISSGLGDIFSTGWGPAVGVTFDMGRRAAFQFEYAFRRFHAENYIDTFGGTFTAFHDTHQLAFDFVFNLNPEESRVRVYLIGGPGAYYRTAAITEYIGSGIVCDPYWYICGTYPITAIIGERGGWDFGFNIGGGVGFKMGDTAEFTIESRYHFVQGPKVTTNDPSITTENRANGYYVPLTFGFRF